MQEKAKAFSRRGPAEASNIYVSVSKVTEQRQSDVDPSKVRVVGFASCTRDTAHMISISNTGASGFQDLIFSS